MMESEFVECNDVERILRGLVGSGIIDEVQTEGEPWRASTLGILNAVLDTIHPGKRLAIRYDDDGAVAGICMMSVEPTNRARNVTISLHDLAKSIEAL